MLMGAFLIVRTASLVLRRLVSTENGNGSWLSWVLLRGVVGRVERGWTSRRNEIGCE